MTTVTTPTGHIIQVNGNDWKGQERIHYDGELVSLGHSAVGGTWFFDVEEDGESVQYEVKFGTRFWGGCYHIMRRSGRIFFCNQ